jgi:hypothetical protein
MEVARGAGQRRAKSHLCCRPLENVTPVRRQNDTSHRHAPKQKQRDAIVHESTLWESRDHMADPHAGSYRDSFAHGKAPCDHYLGDLVRREDKTGQQELL